MFIRSEKSVGEFIRFYPIVSLIVIINVLLFILMYYTTKSISDFIYGWGVGYNPAVSGGEYWRLFTPIFLHGGFTHVAFNSFSLVLFGPALERMIGKPMFIFAYIAMGFVGNLGTYVIDMQSKIPHLGASTSIYGLFGVYLFMRVFRKHLIDAASAQIVTTITVIGLIMTFIQPNINIAGHLFGLVGGVLIAPLILLKARPFTQPRYVYKPRKSNDDNTVSFNPNRWKRKKYRSPEQRQKIIILTVIALIIIGTIIQYYR